MPVVKYVGTSHYRILDAADAKRAEPPVEGFKKTTWTRNGNQEVSAAALEWILRDLSDEFVEVEQGQNEVKAATGDAGEGPVQGSGGDAPASRVSKSTAKTS